MTVALSGDAFVLSSFRCLLPVRSFFRSPPRNKAIGTGRLLPDGHIGRMAVVKEWRRRGVGAALLQALMAEAQQRGHTEVALAAQLQAMEFYRGFGFAPDLRRN